MGKILANFCLVAFLVILFCSYPIQAQLHQNFLDCLSLSSDDAASISSVIYTPSNSSYSTILDQSIRNLRFASPEYPKPQVIITPVNESQIPPVVLCAKEHGLQIRTRSGGHDYEGVSYMSEIPFVIIDMFILNNIDIDLETRTAWIQTGATNGQMYHKLYNTNVTLGFPGGSCPTVGVAGLFSGGGYGWLMRKHGLAADNLIDARIVDVNGRILDREAMGEDFFWAIRGGGGASFGVVLAWRVQLVTMPEIVTVFLVSRTLEQNLTDLVHRWQYAAPSISNDILISISVNIVNTSDGGRTIQGNFASMYLGREDQLLPILDRDFPELGVTAEDCTQVRWIQSNVLFGGFTLDTNIDYLLSRNPDIPSAIKATRFPFKAKLDYIHTPFPKEAIEGMWKLMLKRSPDTAELVFVPYGGRMNEISESAIPFPHRAGTLYKIQQLAYWNHTGDSKQSLKWVRGFYKYLTPYVSKNPRLGYSNYRDFDLGMNNIGNANTSYAQASKWGLRYYKGNFKRLAQVKTIVDPSNFFKHEQSIPLLKFNDVIATEGAAASM